MPDNSCKWNKISHGINVDIVLFAFVPNFRCTGISENMIRILLNIITANIDVVHKLGKVKKFMQGQTQ